MKIKRIIAIILLSVLALGLVSCGDDTPDGMHDVSVAGEPFILYVPVSWTKNTTSGISGAFFSSLDKITVSARHIKSELTVSEYADMLISEYESSLDDFTIVGDTGSADDTSKNALTVAGQNAKLIKFKYTNVEDIKSFTSHQYVTKYGEDIVIIAFYAPTDKMGDMSEHITMIIDNFVLKDKATADTDVLTDKNTPEGMKIASAGHIEYRLYVPMSWVCNSESGVSEAYYPSESRPNVTVTSYSPDKDIELDTFVGDCLSLYTETLEEYEEIGMKERQLCGRDALSYTYATTYDGERYIIMQTTLKYNGIFYTITYTALDSDFYTYKSDVESMISAFTFR